MFSGELRIIALIFITYGLQNIVGVSITTETKSEALISLYHS